MDMSGPRWKKGKDGQDFAALAAANPMSSIISQLQASLRDCKTVAILSGCHAILEVGPEQAVLLKRSAFGQTMETTERDKQWFQLGPEEIFYLCHGLKCVKVLLENEIQMSEKELWDHLRSIRQPFPELYKAYLHLRSMNWVVRSGLQYGADFVAYRHHPALVHSEYAVLVLSEGDEFDNGCGRFKVWSDLMCALRASGSVAKTLLVLTISSKGCDLNCPACLEQFVVQERTIRRWIPQQCREEEHKLDRDEADREHKVDGEKHKPYIGSVMFDYWSLLLSFTILSGLLVYKLKFCLKK